MQVIFESWWLLLTGAITSIRIFFLSFLIAAVLAALLGILRQSKSVLLRIVTTVWVEFFRGISTVVLLFWLYFALPFFGISLSAEFAAVIGLGLVHGAYGSEVVRGAMESVGRDQWEAAIALGYTRRQTLMDIIWPQGFIKMLPPLSNSLVLLLKGTSIASIITVAELTFQSNLIVTRTLAVIPTFTCVLLIYYGIAVLLIKTVRYFEFLLGQWRPRASGLLG
jgi:polar amino acid transport system permease protein